jgi:hypothetical protein
MVYTSDILCFKLLEGIGAIKANSLKKNHNAYQDCVTAPLNREYDNGVAGQEDQPEECISSNNLHEVLSAVSKVSLFESPESIKLTFTSFLVAEDSPCCSFKSSTSPGMAPRGQNFNAITGQHTTTDSFNADTRCQNKVVFNSSNAS